MKAKARADRLDAEFTPGPHCGAFESHGFQMRLCAPAGGLRARWMGRRWVIDPAGRDVLVRVVLLEMLSGAMYLTVTRSESRTVPFIIPVDAINPERPTFTLGPADLLGTGDEVCLSVRLTNG